LISKETQPYDVPENILLRGQTKHFGLQMMLYDYFTKQGKKIPKHIDKKGLYETYDSSVIKMRSGTYKCRRRTSGGETAILNADKKELTLMIKELTYKSDTKIDSRPSFLQFTDVIEVYEVLSDEVTPQNYHEFFKHLVPDRKRMTFANCSGTFHMLDKSPTKYATIDGICSSIGMRIRPFRETMDYPVFYSDEDHFMYLVALQNRLDQSA
jgi:hypothetical protein